MLDPQIRSHVGIISSVSAAASHTLGVIIGNYKGLFETYREKAIRIPLYTKIARSCYRFSIQLQLDMFFELKSRDEKRYISTVYVSERTVKKCHWKLVRWSFLDWGAYWMAFEDLSVETYISWKFDQEPFEHEWQNRIFGSRSYIF